MLLQAQSLLGLVAIPLLAWMLSENRSLLATSKTLRLVGAGIGLQLAVAGVLIGVPALQGLVMWPARGVDAIQSATSDGVRVVLGYLGGGPAPFDVTHPERSFVLAFQALPIIVVMSVLSKMLYHWGMLQRLVRAFAWALKRTLGISGPVGTAAAANIFVGMVEAPLLVKPYLASMSRSGLFATMSVGMAGVAGTVLALYAGLLRDHVPGAAGHLIIASIISVPAALMISFLMVPEAVGRAPAERAHSDVEEAAAPALVSLEDAPRSTMDAIAQGTREGVDLFVHVAAMLVVAVALVSLANMLLAMAAAPFGSPIRLEEMFGVPFAGLAWLTGIPWSECGTAGSLLGIKTVLNELVAYLRLADLPADALSPRSRLIMTYALCGFANLGSLGIMIGGLVTMVPERRGEIVELGGRTVVAGTLATLMTATVIGLMTPP